MSIAGDVVLALESALGGIRIASRDEFALVAELAEKLPQVKTSVPPKLLTWSPIVGGMEYDADGKPMVLKKRKNADFGPSKIDPEGGIDLPSPVGFLTKLGDFIALNAKGAKVEPVVLLLLGCDGAFAQEAPEGAVCRRALIEACRIARARGALLVLVGRDTEMTADVADEMLSFEHGLPSMRTSRDRIVQFLGDHKLALSPQELDEIVAAGQGLTLSRQLDAIGLAMNRAAREKRRIAVADVLRFKERNMSDGAVVVRKPRMQLNEIVGYDLLKVFLGEAHVAMSPGARAAGIAAPKGILLTGPPSTGKTKLPEAIAKDWGVSWASLDVSALFQSYIGQSEQRMREALEAATRMAPCVLHVDEVDTAFSSRAQGGDADGGTARRMFGTFLRWLSDKEAEVFVVMTSNRPEDLDAALIRKGRLDALFFVDLPPIDQREAIWRHYLAKAKIHEAVGPDEVLQRLARDSADYAGGEIENIIEGVKRSAFAQKRAANISDVVLALATEIPLARSKADEIKMMREWARQYARPAHALASPAAAT